MEFLFALIPIALVVGLLVFFLKHGLDRDRVSEYVESRGGKIIDSNWAPFGKGWFGEKGERIYKVRYVDADGHEHQATAKTSMWTGVFWTEDNIVKYADRIEKEKSLDIENRSLEDENRILRQEIARLKKKKEEDEQREYFK